MLRVLFKTKKLRQFSCCLREEGEVRSESFVEKASVLSAAGKVSRLLRPINYFFIQYGNEPRPRATISTKHDDMSYIYNKLKWHCCTGDSALSYLINREE